jgi:hypothetical protein
MRSRLRAVRGSALSRWIEEARFLGGLMFFQEMPRAIAGLFCFWSARVFQVPPLPPSQLCKVFERDYLGWYLGLH